MKNDSLSHITAEWDQVELVYPKELNNQLILKCVSEILINPDGRTNGYYNLENDGKRQKLKIYHLFSNGNLLNLIREKLEKYALSELDIKYYKILYNIDHDISDLMSGISAQKIYVDYSLSSLPILLQWIQACENKKISRFSFAFDLMVMHILSDKVRAVYDLNSECNYPASFLCYRSHADGFFVRSKNEEKMRGEMESQYQTQKEIFHKRFLRIKNTQTSEQDLFLQHWHTYFNEKRLLIETEMSEKRLGFVNYFMGEMSDFYEISDNNIHAKMQGERIIQSYVSKDKNFQVVRLLTGLLYLTLHRLGLSLPERYHLCYIINRTIEDVYSITAEKALMDLKSKLKKRRMRKILTLGLSA